MKSTALSRARLNRHGLPVMALLLLTASLMLTAGPLLKTKNKNAGNADGSMTEQQQRDYLEQYKTKLISPGEEAMWKGGASNAGYHYLGCAKTFALMGRAFANALLDLNKE